MNRDSGPTLFLICGLPGAGKTTLAKRLEVEHAALRLTPDEWIADLLPEGWDRAELDRLRTPVETIQWKVAQRVLALGRSVVLDWGLWSREERDQLREGARAVGARAEVRYLNPPREELLARLARRGRGSGPGEFEVSEEELDLWASWLEPPGQDELEGSAAEGETT